MTSRYRVCVDDRETERTWYVTPSFTLALSPDRAARFSREVALEVGSMFERVRGSWRARLEL